MKWIVAHIKWIMLVTHSSEWDYDARSHVLVTFVRKSP